MAGRKRLQVDLSDGAYERLQRVADEEGRPIAEVVRRALNVEDILREEQERGAKVLIESEDGEVRQLVVA